MMRVSMDILLLLIAKVGKWGDLWDEAVVSLFESVYEVAFFRISEVFFNISCEFTKEITLC